MRPIILGRVDARWQMTPSASGQLDAWQPSSGLIVSGLVVVAPFLTFGVVQYMNGASASIFASVSHGFRGARVGS